MKTFWIDFEKTEGKNLPIGTWLGCGVTANNINDAVDLLKRNLFRDWELVPILSVKEDVSIDDLEKNHVLPNIGNIMIRGIWYPNLGK